MTAPISQAEWERLRRESIAAVDDIVEQVGLPKVLLPYQAKAVGLLDSTATSVLFVEKSRRIGLTWGLAAYAALRAGKSKAARGMDVMYISYSQEMTREFIDACAMWARAYGIAAAEMDEMLFDDSDQSGERSIKAFRIQFSSGFEIIALSSAPRSLRGKQGCVIIDEAAFVDNLAELLKAALAFLMWGGQVVVCSTHDGTENPFNEVIQDILGGRKPYTHMRIDLDQALQDGLYQRICLVTGVEWTPEGEAKWRQDIIDFYGEGADEELFCVPTMGSGAWLPAPLIEARMREDGHLLRLELPADFLHLDKFKQAALLEPFIEDLKAALKALNLDMRYAFGFDFGRTSDLTVGTLLGIDQMLTRHEALTVELRGVPFKEQEEIVELIFDAIRERLIGSAFDGVGMGLSVAEAMARKYGERIEGEGGLVEIVKFTEDWYRVNMPPLKAAIEDDKLLLIPDEDHLTDLRKVKLIRGIPRVPPTRDTEKASGKGSKRHGDFAIALALAHYASRQRITEYDYRSAATAQAADELTVQHHDDDRPSALGRLTAAMKGWL